MLPAKGITPKEIETSQFPDALLAALTPKPTYFASFNATKKRSPGDLFAHVYLAPAHVTLQAVVDALEDLPYEVDVSQPMSSITQVAGDGELGETLEISVVGVATLADNPLIPIGVIFFSMRLSASPKRMGTTATVDFTSVAVGKKYRRRQIGHHLALAAGSLCRDYIEKFFEAYPRPQYFINLCGDFVSKGGEKLFYTMFDEVSVLQEEYPVEIVADAGW